MGSNLKGHLENYQSREQSWIRVSAVRMLMVSEPVWGYVGRDSLLLLQYSAERLKVSALT